MTNKEAARTLLYGLSREAGRDEYLDAICMAICALMREEAAGKGKHEKQEPVPQDTLQQDEVVWHDPKSDPPKENGIYIVITDDDLDFTRGCIYENGKWFNGTSIYIPVKWTEYREDLDCLYYA